MNLFQLAKRFLRERLGRYGIVLLWMLLLGIVFYLSDISLSLLCYAAALMLFFGGIYTCVEFQRFVRTSRTLQSCLAQGMLVASTLPPPEGTVQAGYQALLQKLLLQYTDSLHASEQSEQDMISYYTLWVHQIKTPIAAMRLLLQTEENPAQAELEAELFRIEQYVDMVLGYLRVDGRSTDFVFERYSLEAIVKRAIRKYAKSFIRKKLILELYDLDCMVLTDEKWLLFVLEQLLSNALKYTGTGGTIRIYAEPGPVLVLADTGIGIAPEDLPRIFERGYTGYNGRHEQRSTGIGLYLCRRILTKLGHSISITSEIDRGTLVRISLEKPQIVSE